MCGRYTFIPDRDFFDRFSVSNRSHKLQGSYNVSPGMIMPAVINTAQNQVEDLKWGFVPFWAKDPNIGYRMINARSEEVAAKPAFRKAIRSQRCLIPANSFFEWQKSGTSRSVRKTPYMFRLTDLSCFSFAGLYDTWTDAAGSTLKTFTILTTRANDLVATVHDRMPVILSLSAEFRWLDPAVHEPNQIASLMLPYPSSAMQKIAVSQAVNNPSNNTPEVIQPLNSQ